MKKLNKTKFAILGLLTIEPLSGYDIKKWIERSIGYFWSESNGQIYPTLNQLLKEKLIVLSENKSNGKKLRNIYAITSKGHLELKKWLKEGNEKSVHRDETLLKLFFGKNSSKEESIQKLKEREQKLESRLAEFNLILNQLEKRSKSSHYIYWLLTLKNGISGVKAELAWCRDSIKTLIKVKHV